MPICPRCKLRMSRGHCLATLQALKTGKNREEEFFDAIDEGEFENRILSFPTQMSRMLVEQVINILGFKPTTTQLRPQGICLKVCTKVVALLNGYDADFLHLINFL